MTNKSESFSIEAYWQKATVASGIPLADTRQYLRGIIKAYSSPSRHYHSLQHLEQVFTLVNEFEKELLHPDAVYFAIFYHDIVYNTWRKDNENQSAKLSATVLDAMGYDNKFINLVYHLISSTQHHLPKYATNDFYYFLDADLAILGSTPEQYQQYTQQIRKEYRLIPDLLYRPARKAILQQLQQRPKLYYTQALQQRFKAQALTNLAWEISTL